MNRGLILSFILILFLRLSATTGADLNRAKSYQRNLPWAFEENKGQVIGTDSASVRYFYKKGNLTMFLTEKGIVYQFEKSHAIDGQNPQRLRVASHQGGRRDSIPKKIRKETYRMDVELFGANPHAEIVAESKSADYLNYYNQNALDVHSYQKIIYKNIYPNIDWVIYTTNSKRSTDDKNSKWVKYDFIVHPGGHPQDIVLKTKWVEDIALNADGSLNLVNRMGSITEQKPVSFQEGREVETKFTISSDQIQFAIADYNRECDLVIDPTLAWATLYGGNKYDLLENCAVDGNSNIYAAGSTESETYIASGGFQNTISSEKYDGFFVKFDTEGHRLWATYYGNGGSFRNSIACDKSGNVYFATSCYLSGMSTPGAFQANIRLYGSDIIAKFRPDGTRVWSTYYNDFEIMNCQIDKNNHLIVSGRVNSSILSTTSGVHKTTFGGVYDVYIAKFDTNGTRLWATYYGGNKKDLFWGSSVDKEGNIFVSGTTESKSNIAYAGFMNTKKDCVYSNSGDSANSFLAKFNSSGQLQWATYFSGDTFLSMSAMCATDSSGNVFLLTRQQDIGLLTPPFLSTYSSKNNQSCLTKFSSSGVRLWTRFCGESVGTDAVIIGLNFCSVDIQNNVYVHGFLPCGMTSSVSGGAQSVPSYCTNSYVTDGVLYKYDNDGNKKWGYMYGGAGWDAALRCVFNKKNDIFFVGHTDTFGSVYKSTTYTYKGFQPTYHGETEGTVAKLCGSIDTPRISIVSNRGTSICGSKIVQLHALDTFEGLYPQYLWKKNGIAIGSDTNILVTAISDNDTISCRLISSANCIAIDTVWSNLLIMKIKAADTTYLKDSTCSNQPYIFNNTSLLSSGQYRDTLLSSLGCDSFIFLDLLVRQVSQVNLNVTTTCTAPSYFFKGQNRTQSGIYQDTLKNRYGCDSFVILNLTVIKPSSSVINVSICPGQSYLFDGIARTTTGTYTRIIPNASGCDSTITLSLTVLTTPATESKTIWGCTPFIYQNKTYYNHATVIDTIKSAYGCDSVHRTNSIYLKPTPTKASPLNYTVCDSVIVKGVKHTTTFSYTDTFRTTADIVCDSLYQPVNYTVKYTPSLTISPKQIDTFYKGETVRLYPSLVKNYLWNTGQMTRTIQFQIFSDQSLYVIGWDSDECRDTAYLQLVAIDPTILDFPTGFSPQSSTAENKTFKPNINGKVEAIRFEVYNRLGEKIYSSLLPNMMGWDGTFQGKDCPTGIYSYICEYTTNRRHYFKSGDVMLVR